MRLARNPRPGPYVRLALLGVAAVLCSAAQCRQQGTFSDYDVLHGTVQRLRPESSELVVAATNPWSDQSRTVTLNCLTTSDTEIYVNDRFCSFEAIAIGDQVELIGYRESNTRGERFVVVLANIQRNSKLPPPPEIVPPSDNNEANAEES